MDKVVLSMKERTDKIGEAQSKIAESIALIKDAVDGLYCEERVKIYLVNHLVCFLDGNHTFLYRDMNLDKVRDEIINELEDGIEG